MGQTSTLNRLRGALLIFLALFCYDIAYAQGCLREPSEFIIEENAGKCRIVFEYPDDLPDISCGVPGTPNGTTGAILTYFAIEDDYLGTIVFYDVAGGDCSDINAVTALQYGSEENTIQTAYAPQLCGLQYSRRITITVRYLDGTENICEPENPDPLPVEWVSFIAEGQNNRTIQLKWAVADQVNNSHFEVQHSSDGNTFRTIDVIRGDGTLTGFRDFNYFHTSPKYGRNYYRLRQVDFDGTSDLSEVSFVDLNLKKVANVFPSVIIDHINIGIEINAPKRGIAKIQLVDMNGTLISNTSMEVDEGISLNRIDISGSLTSGLYFIHVQLDGNRVESHKLVKTSL